MDATSIAFAPLIDWTAIAALAALSALIVGFAFWRRARGAFWRLVASLAVLLGLANPSLVQEERRQLPDVVFLAVDESASQAIGERQARTRAAAEYLKAALSRLPDVELREIAISGSGLDDNGSRLFGPLEETLADVPREQVAGLFVVSDGQIHDAPADLAALGITAPLHLLLTGERNEADRRLTIVKAPTFGIVGKPQELIVRVDDLAGADVGSATLTLTISGQEAQIQSIQIGRDVPITFQLERRGATLIELSVNAGPAELSLLNNRAALEVSGVRDRLRVLLVSGEPHNGERVWRNILKSDPAVDLVHFTILRPPEKQDGTPINELSLIAFPTRELFEEKLQDFDLIIFDRYRQRGVLPSIYLDNVARYVEGGGALLEAMGPASASALSLYRTPLARIMLTEPSGEVIEEGFKPEVTAVGRRHPVTATLTGIGQVGEEPSWGRWFRLIDARLPSNGETVMSGPGGRPLLVLGHVGEGRVAQLLSDQVWLWARGFEGGGPQAELLRRIAHWLMKEPDLEEEDLRAHIAGNQLIIDRRSISSDIPTIQVTAPSGELKTLNLAEGADGVQHGTLAIEEAGIYRINDGQRTILASAGPLNAKEFQDLRASDEPLGALIQASGGTALYLVDEAEPKLRKVSAERDAFGRDWLGVTSREAYVVTGIAEAPLLPAWALLALALGAAFLAWQREGQ